MRQHVLYVLAPSRADKVKKVMERLNAKEIQGSPITFNYELTHRLLGDLTLQISYLTNLDGVAPHMRTHPVDLLIYDERGADGKEAVNAISHIKADVTRLAELWGPDFHFPMSRVVSILAHDNKRMHRSFELGRLHVRDVFVSPKNTAVVLRWLYHIFSHGVKRTNQVGFALSGGALDGLLYQVGVLFALETGIDGKRIDSCQAVSGISSGAIAGALIAGKIPLGETIRSFYGNSKKLPHLKSTTIFDLAGSTIVQRLATTSIGIDNFKPNRWLSATLKSIPTGFFKGSNLEDHIRKIMSAYGNPEHLDEVDTKLFVGATDQDTFEHVIFGLPPLDNVSIVNALRASTALPPVFMPKTINGRNYIDGQVTRSCNINPLIDIGCRLVFIIDPLKPYRHLTAGATDKLGGFYGVIQTIKALVSTRFEENLKHASERFPDVDFLIFQPDEECAKMMAGSPLRYRIRTEIIELAYRSTLRKIRNRYQVYATKLDRYGFQLKPQEDLKQMERNYDKILESSR